MPENFNPDRLDKILDKQFVMTDGKGRIDRIRDLYTTFNDQVDLNALRDGGYVEVVDKMMEPVTMSFDDHAPEVIAYWAKQGMVKEFHGQDDVMSWTEYEAKTGYHWEDVNHVAPRMPGSFGTPLCRFLRSAPRTRAASTPRWWCSTAASTPSASSTAGAGSRKLPAGSGS